MRPSTLEFLTVTLFALMTMSPLTSFASITVPFVLTVRPLMELSVTPAGTPVVEAVGQVPVVPGSGAGVGSVVGVGSGIGSGSGVGLGSVVGVGSGVGLGLGVRACCSGFSVCCVDWCQSRVLALAGRRAQRRRFVGGGDGYSQAAKHPLMMANVLPHTTAERRRDEKDRCAAGDFFKNPPSFSHI